MTRYKSFQTTKNKLNNLWQDSFSNSSNIKNLKKKYIQINSKIFQKKIISIPVFNNELIVDAVDLNNDPIYFQIYLENYPDWAIPMTRVIPIFYTENAYNLDNPTTNINLSHNYIFQKIDNTNILLNLELSGIISQQIDTGEGTESIDLPIYSDLNLYIFNHRNYNYPQHFSN